MPVTGRLAAAVTLAMLLATAALAQPVSLEAIVREPFRFAGRMVTLRGIVGLIDRAAPRPTFQLIDGVRSIRVVAPPSPPIKPGDRVEVEGMFNAGANQVHAIRLTWR
jgi:hypothetical protein